jgi:PiT family inorganic phosphate transporter
VRWRTAGRIAIGWVITIPASAAVGALASWIALSGTIGILVDALVAVAVIVWIFVYSRRNRVHAKNVQVEPTAFVRPKRRKSSKVRGAAQ